MAEAGRHVKRWVIGFVGGIVLLVGIIIIPYPGPGWLTVFAGLAILSTEFTWAQRLLHFARGKYEAWQLWLLAQNRFIRVAFFLLTTIIVILTLWLLNVYGQINQLLSLGLDWLNSPIFQ